MSVRRERNELSREPGEPLAVRNGAATLRDVAAQARVNVATASVVLNNTRSGTRVSDATRERILQAAAALQYRPNAAARGMKSRRMDTIGVISGIEAGELNLYFLELLNGIMEAAVEHGQNTTVFSVRDWKAEEAKIQGFCDGRVDGFILIGSRLRPEFARRLWGHAPFVTIHGEERRPDIWNLDVNNEAGAYAIVRLLIDRGHRRILHLTGDDINAATGERVAGYRRALEEAGIPFDKSLIVPCRFSHVAGKHQMAALLDERRFDPLPTAVFCANDAIACGCQEAIIARGLRIPEDISVVGFDDTLEARMVTPQLTTVRQPFHEMGRQAVELLFAEIDYAAGRSEKRLTQTVEAPHRRLFDTTLIERASVGPPPPVPISGARPPTISG